MTEARHRSTKGPFRRGRSSSSSRSQARTRTQEVVPGKRVGPRREALKGRRKEQRRKRALAAVGAGVLALAAGLGIAYLVADDGTKPVAVPSDPIATEEPTAGTMLIFGTDSSRDQERVVWLSLLIADSAEQVGAVAYIPAHTAVEVPGRGLESVSDAYSDGGVPLLLVTLENLLGVSIDRYLELAPADARVLLEGVGPLSVDVPGEVRVGVGQSQARLLFDDGPQRLSGSFLQQLLYVVGVDGDDIELGGRHLAFWDGLFEAWASDTPALVDVISSSSGALGKSDVPPEEVASFLGELAAIPPENRFLRSIPVSPLEVPGNRLYVADEVELAAFVVEVAGTAAPASDDIRVQVLNGNGIPGIGQDVADLLVGEGFRVILSGNARRLDHEKTLIITYDSSEVGMALAERARSLLGGGEIQISGQDQGIVDLTIVVGEDFQRAR